MRLFYSLLTALIFTASLLGQPPQKMSYQAVVRNIRNELVRSMVVGVQISLYKENVFGTPVFVETHTPTINENGLVTIEIGMGINKLGNFAEIDWSSGTFFIKSEFDLAGGTDYTITTSSQMLSVPYALYSKTSEQGDQTELKFNKLYNTVFAGGLVSDVDGNSYNTVKIGRQVWMSENLKTTKYNDGTEIPNICYPPDWRNLISSAYCGDLLSDYGFLYNGYTLSFASNKNVCPLGWHVPSKDEWFTLLNFLGGDTVAGGKMKEIGTIHWRNPNTGATNEAGFTALGAPMLDPSGISESSKLGALWWTSTMSDASYCWYLYITYSSKSAVTQTGNIRMGINIRCLKDN